MSTSLTDAVQEYYGKTLRSSVDLKTSACCTPDAMPGFVKAALTRVHDDVLMKYYGCGLIAPENLEGTRILDLGSGSGRDVFVLSQLVGEKGSVVGVDFTPEQLATATKHEEWHQKKFGYARKNTDFRLGNIEELPALGLAKNSFDVVVSNCVLNLVTDKEKVLTDVFGLLKEGGEFYFSDVYASRRVPEELTIDPVLRGECLSGALYWNDFVNAAKRAGFKDPRIVESRLLQISDPAISSRLRGIDFYSVTYRLFKLQDLEPACEDYGQAIRYRGGIPHHESAFLLDGHHNFEKGKVSSVCGNTWMMLEKTRFREHFDFIGDFQTHYGIFPGCGTEIPFSRTTEGSAATSGSCC